MPNSPVFRPFSASKPADRDAILAALRARIATVTEAPDPRNGGRRSTAGLGAEPVDGHLPGGGLAAGGVHEVAAEGFGDLPAALGFCAAVAIRFMEAAGRGPVIWCTRTTARVEFGTLYGPGLAGFGLDPSRLLVVETAHVRDLLWTLEQAARLPGLAAVVGDAGPAVSYDLTASRRLQLAARDGAVPVVVLRGHGPAACGTSAALTRWRIAAVPASGVHVGMPTWAVALERARGVPPARWRLVWDPVLKSFAVPMRTKASPKPETVIAIAEDGFRAAG